MGEKEQVKSKKDSKRDSKNKASFYYAIFNLIKQGKSPTFISKEYKIPKQNLYHYTKRLLDEKIIRKEGRGRNSKWFPLVKTFSLGTRPTTNLHALQINIPILSGEIKGLDWEIKEELRNWTPKYKKLGILGGLTIKNNNNKSISIFAHQRDIKDLKEVDALSFDIRNWALAYFRDTFNVTLDLFNAEVKNLNLATQDKESEGMQKKGEKFELDLDKKAEKIFPKDKIDGKAWIDGSPFDFSAETNDKEWKRAYLSMPFMMQQIVQATHYIAKNYASHVKLVEKASKVMEKLDKRLSQTKLKEWL